MKLVQNWKQAWRMFSVQIAAGIAVWTMLPPETQASVVGLFGFPEEKVPAIMALILIVARVIEQPKVRM